MRLIFKGSLAFIVLFACAFPLFAEQPSGTTPKTPIVTPADDAVALIASMREDKFENFDAALNYYFKRRKSENAVEKRSGLEVLGEIGSALLRKSRVLLSKIDTTKVSLEEVAKIDLNKTDPNTLPQDVKIVLAANQCEAEGILYVKEAAENLTGSLSARFWTILGEHSLILGNTETCSDMLEKAISADSLYAPSYALRGRLNAALKEYRKAADDFQTAMGYEKSGNILPLILSAGMAWQEVRDYAKAEKYFKEAIEKDPDNLLWRVHLLLCLNGLGDTGAAEKLHTEILARFSTRPPAMSVEDYSRWQADNTWQQIDEFFVQEHRVRVYENLGATLLKLNKVSVEEGMFHFLFTLEGGETMPDMSLALESKKPEKSEDGRDFFLAMYRNDRRMPYGLAGHNLMSYQELKQIALDIFNGKREPVSTTSPAAGGIGAEYESLPDMDEKTITPEEYFKIKLEKDKKEEEKNK